MARTPAEPTAAPKPAPRPAAPDDGRKPSLLLSKPFWLRAFGLVAAGILAVVLMDLAVMPIWTRHGDSIRVPEVRQMSADAAEDVLRDAGLDGELREQPFNPNLPPDIVVDQTPLPDAEVKPGRRVYYYVNARPREMVQVPDIASRSEGVARADLEAAGLLVGEVIMDSVHTPYEGTVTRQLPRGGAQAPQGTRVTLWVSPGLGRDRVAVPDVTGLAPAEARRVIREADLWVDSPNARGDSIRWQEPRAGTRLREGEEVRIHTTAQPADGASDDAPAERPAASGAPRPPRTPQPDRPATAPAPAPAPAPDLERPAPPPPNPEADGGDKPP
ncbi:MAG TPA: PASTA domain-containing protein, partial [Rhodothermales bacterium]|nr:PASTA domain-containing protein [Rhodothermales bacterium]